MSSDREHAVELHDIAQSIDEAMFGSGRPARMSGCILKDTKGGPGS